MRRLQRGKYALNLVACVCRAGGEASGLEGCQNICTVEIEKHRVHTQVGYCHTARTAGRQVEGLRHGGEVRRRLEARRVGISVNVVPD